MTRKAEEWMNTKEAAALLTEKVGRPVSEAYVRWLGGKAKLTRKRVDNRTWLYKKSDVASYPLATHKKQQA